MGFKRSNKKVRKSPYLHLYAQSIAYSAALNTENYMRYVSNYKFILQKNFYKKL